MIHFLETGLYTEEVPVGGKKGGGGKARSKEKWGVGGGSLFSTAAIIRADGTYTLKFKDNLARRGSRVEI